MEGGGKRAWCRKQQSPPIALVQCNSPSKECSRPSLSLWPSSLPKHSKNVGKEEEASTKDPQEFPHSGGRVIHATKAILKKGSEMIPPCSHSKQQNMSYTLSQLLWVLLTGSIDMDTKEDPNESLELASWCGHTLLQSEHDVLRSAHAEKKNHIVSTNNCSKNKTAVSRCPVLGLRNSSYKSLSRQS